jgi:ABC-type branched-subunit amino acid transport system substrate-binding protein
VETLALLAKDELDENRIDVLWKAHFIDRQMREALTNALREKRGQVVEQRQAADSTARYRRSAEP